MQGVLRPSWGKFAGGSTQCSTAARTSACRATEAMVSGGNWRMHHGVERLQIPDAGEGFVVVGVWRGQMDHLVEIAVVDSSLPVDADQRAAHDVRDCLWIEIIYQQLHVGFSFTASLEVVREAVDWEVGQCEELIECDSELVLELGSVLRLQGRLRGREKCSSRVVDEVELQRRVGPSVT